jgi:hypothetical protein
MIDLVTEGLGTLTPDFLMQGAAWEASFAGTAPVREICVMRGGEKIRERPVRL